MSLKEIVDGILKEKKRSLTWLSEKMGKTFDGLRLGLNNESVKYKDIITMASILEVSPATFFSMNTKDPKTVPSDAVIQKANFDTYLELIQSLKDQLKDKDKIIALLEQGAKINS